MQMLCEECNDFLEVAEAIRSLGLTILKGITEVHGEKTWICFVVEVCLNYLLQWEQVSMISLKYFRITNRWVL
jgi:hypothetical protein